MSDDDAESAIRAVRANMERALDQIARDMRLFHDDRARKLTRRAERIEKRYDALTALAEKLRKDIERIGGEDLANAETEEQRERVRGHLDGLRSALWQFESLP